MFFSNSAACALIVAFKTSFNCCKSDDPFIKYFGLDHAKLHHLWMATMDQCCAMLTPKYGRTLSATPDMPAKWLRT